MTTIGIPQTSAELALWLAARYAALAARAHEQEATLDRFATRLTALRSRLLSE